MWHYSDSGICGSAAAATLSMKTPGETAMAGEKTTNNNQLTAVAAMVTEMAMMKAMVTMMKMKGNGGGGGSGR